jgi:hypothetical protein
MVRQENGVTFIWYEKGTKKVRILSVENLVCFLVVRKWYENGTKVLHGLQTAESLYHFRTYTTPTVPFSYHTYHPLTS